MLIEVLDYPMPLVKNETNRRNIMENTGITAKVIEDSISESGKRIVTLQVKFPRFILPEFNTHRVFSRNFSSSRAIPTAKLIEQVRTDYAHPVHWGQNQPGMQAAVEMEEPHKVRSMSIWWEAAQAACDFAEAMAKEGAHKQIVNRIIEPYLFANGIVTSTEWDNWFELRDHEDAQPEIRALAIEMKFAMSKSTPTLLRAGQWHLPYITKEDRNKYDTNTLLKISSARCCRVSYLKHDGTNPNVDEDLALFERLAGAVPLHASPLEHQATPEPLIQENWGNFKHWTQYRKIWEKTIYNK